MKINYTYFTYDTKNLMSYEIIYIYRDTIQKYYFRIRFNHILLIVKNKRTKKCRIYIYKNYMREID